MQCRNKPKHGFICAETIAWDQLGDYKFYVATCSCGWKNTSGNSTPNFAKLMWEGYHLHKIEDFQS